MSSNSTYAVRFIQKQVGLQSCNRWCTDQPVIQAYSAAPSLPVHAKVIVTFCGTQTTEATLGLPESKVQMAPAARVKRSKGAG